MDLIETCQMIIGFEELGTKRHIDTMRGMKTKQQQLNHLGTVIDTDSDNENIVLAKALFENCL